MYHRCASGREGSVIVDLLAFVVSHIIGHWVCNLLPYIISTISPSQYLFYFIVL